MEGNRYEDSSTERPTSSLLSTPRRLSVHPSVSWGGLEFEKDPATQQLPPAPAPAPPRLPGLLSKLGPVCSSHRQLMKAAGLYDESRTKQVEDQINYDHLRKLERMFREADIDGGGGLDMEEFRSAMKKIMGDVSDEDIDVIFMKVDTNCDGAVDWEEYLNYMLREYRGKDDMLKNKMLPEFQTTMKPVSVAHSEEIVKIQFFPNQNRGLLERARKSRSPSGRFLTVSRDGILQYWSDTFKRLRTVVLDQSKRRHSLKLWVIDMVCLTNINLLAVATTDQDIEFFDIGGNKCDRIFTLVDLEGCATAMDYWTDGRKAIFSVGDVKGNVLIFTSSDVVMNGLFNVRSYIGGMSRVPVHILLKNKAEQYRNFHVPALHGDWCQQIKYIPQLNLVASCTPAEKTAMALTSLPLHNIVTGGYEPLVRIWNPYVTSSPITQMKGHSTAVTHIMINGQRNTIVSVSKDKNIRVWDLLDHFCLQSIHGRNVPLGNYPISATYYHRPCNYIICATYTLGFFYGVEYVDLDAKTQDQPVCCALYNKNFKQVVSGCYSGVITVWDIMTGQKVMEFSTSSGQPVEITAMTFDTPERRLITALKNGTIKLWNFNNGACLIELPFDDKAEIGCVLYMNQKIFVAGWSKRVTWYLDNKEDEKVIECKHWKSYHSDDISCMDRYGKNLLATASCNGDIVLWSVHSGQAFCRFNASESPLILAPQREFSSDPDIPLLNKSPKKTGCNHRQAMKKCFACSRKATAFKTAIPQRPASAKTHQVTSPIPQRRPASAMPGNRIMRPATSVPGSHIMKPQAAWEPEGSDKTAAGSHAHAAPETGSPKAEIPTWQEEVIASRVGVEKILFLNARERDSHTAILLTSCSDGNIYAWTFGGKGGMLGKFRGGHGHAQDTVVCSMNTDDKNLVLFTGDSLGYLKIWDIMNYCTPRGEIDPEPEISDENLPQPSQNAFRDLIPDYCRIPSDFSSSGITEEEHEGWFTSLIPPVCLSSWRGHLKNVGSIKYVERFRAILTSSHDSTIKLWMLSGRHVGTFGQAVWRLELQSMMTAEVPEDIRRTGSLQTLKVLNEGRQPHWESIRNIVQTLSQQRRQQSMLMDFLHVKSSHDAAGKMQEMMHKETRIIQITDEQIEASYQQWEEFGKLKSDILGSAFKQKFPRPVLKQLPEMKAYVAHKDQPRIYRCIQYTDLQPMFQAYTPDLVTESLQTQAAIEHRATRRAKRWATLKGVVKPTLKSFLLRKRVMEPKE
ncbi:EF-hand calcium-binding domain-containing protein 8 isoform X2 [Podarcis raffonei]|uniref:EF-hand calcium-binding domain-containing protein 8 isoform X2 n=1 Tax=Podarcis raffonei TaxID=65483 RepID=UPI00232948C7|nr:EF-hand calcium-binding domain-containing protein 8 isoform X2 [Podarcis raffonei]